MLVIITLASLIMAKYEFSFCAIGKTYFIEKMDYKKGVFTVRREIFYF